MIGLGGKLKELSRPTGWSDATNVADRVADQFRIVHFMSQEMLPLGPPMTMLVSNAA